MNIHQLDVTLSTGDLNMLVKSFVPEDIPVKNLEFSTRLPHLLLKGKFHKGMTVSFTVRIEPSAQGRQIFLEIVEVDAMMGLGNAVKSMILETLVNKADMPGLSRDGASLVVDVNSVLQSNGLQANVDVSSLLVVEDGIRFTLAGNAALALQNRVFGQ